MLSPPQRVTHLPRQEYSPVCIRAHSDETKKLTGINTECTAEHREGWEGKAPVPPLPEEFGVNEKCEREISGTSWETPGF